MLTDFKNILISSFKNMLNQQRKPQKPYFISKPKRVFFIIEIT
jgi:hypothetical protein